MIKAKWKTQFATKGRHPHGYGDSEPLQPTESAQPLSWRKAENQPYRTPVKWTGIYLLVRVYR
jgi:hypothetical protein